MKMGKRITLALGKGRIDQEEKGKGGWWDEKCRYIKEKVRKALRDWRKNK